MRAAPFATALLILQLCALGSCAKHVGGREPLRIWIDEFFFASGETVLLREAAAATGGAATVAGSTHNRVMQLKSYQLADKVDIMWTGQRVGALCLRVPGAGSPASQTLLRSLSFPLA